MQTEQNQTVSKIGKKRGRPVSQETLSARKKFQQLLNLRKPGTKFTSEQVAAWLKTDDINLANNVIRFAVEHEKVIKTGDVIKKEGKRGRPQCVFMKP
jgi:molybdopterin converting factor small subunit